MMSHTCITCPLSFLDWVHVTSFSQLSCLPSPLLSQLGSLSSPLSSYLVLGACYVIQLLDLLPSGVQYCACISVNLSQSTMLVVAYCWTRKRIQFTWTFTCTFQCTLFYFNNKCFYQKMSNFWVTGKLKQRVRNGMITNSAFCSWQCIQYLLYDVPVFWRRKHNNDNFNNK